MLRQTFFALLLLQVGSFGILVAQENQPDGAQATTKEWLSKLDSADYIGTWESAASIFKAALSSQAWQQASAAVRTPLGAVRQRSEISTVPNKTLPGVPDGDYVVIQFNTVFENKAQAVETVIATLDQDGSWKVAGYFVR
jgi:hypothetical protein